MKIYSFYVKDDQNANYLGKDFSQIIDENFEKSRPVIHNVDIKEEGKKIKVYIQLNTSSLHKIYVEFDIRTYDQVFLSMDIGEKSIRVSNKMKRYSSEILNKYFSNLDRAIDTISRKRAIQEGVKLENIESFINVLDSINKLVLF